MLRSSYLKYVILLLLGTLLSSTTVLFGTIPMRAVRRTYGRSLFWLGHMSVVAWFAILGLVPFAFAVFMLTVLIGIYSEAEEHGTTLFSAALTAILATLGLSVLAGGIWVQQTRMSLLTVIKSEVSSFLSRLTTTGDAFETSVEAIVYQLPSGLVILLMVALATALIWERPILSWFRLPKKESLQSQLLTFHVPDALVWMAMLAILGVVLQHGRPWLETLSVNALNVIAVLYFFQGLAVLAQFFKVYKIAIFWQAFWYIVLIVQLFPLVSLLGFVDYWMGFRDRLLKKSPETKNSF